MVLLKKIAKEMLKETLKEMLKEIQKLMPVLHHPVPYYVKDG
jgi:hypothetical protein